MDITELLGEFVSDGKFIESVDEYDQACEHVVLLLEEAEALFLRGGYSTSVFLSITALEETAKAHIGPFKAHTEARKGNVLYSHEKKHKLAAMPTVPMGKRLPEAIGEASVQRLMAMAHESKFVHLREHALYLDRRNGKFQVPRSHIDRQLAKELLLFAVEAFDDALVGGSNRSMQLSERTDAVFSRTASA